MSGLHTEYNTAGEQLKPLFLPIQINKTTQLKPHTSIHNTGVPGGKDLTSGECSLGQTISI